MENLLECNICLEKYDNKDKTPRILKCGHTFCTKCLKELTKLNSVRDMNLPFVKCPIDKTIGHNNINIEEIPINRIIVDILDYNGFQFEKLTLKEEKNNEKLAYINSAIEKLRELERYSTTNYNLIRENMVSLVTGKNKAIAEISSHYDKIISIVENQKTSSIFQIEKYSKERLSVYNEIMQTIDKYREIAQFNLCRLEMIKNQKVSAMTIADEIDVIHTLGIDQMDSHDYKKDVDKIIKEMQSQFIPKAVVQSEIEEHLIEIINSTQVIIPDTKGSFQGEDIYSLNDELDSLNIGSDSIFWFQQNTKNVYKKNLSVADWVLTENKDNYVFKEMFRVCMLSHDEALITGGGQGFICSNTAVMFSKGYFRKKQNMLTERRSHSTCKAGDFVFVCGGINSQGEPLAACEKFSIVYEKWLKISSMNMAKSHLSICNVNNQYIYSIGGENKFQSLLDVIEKYTIQLDRWEVVNVKLPKKLECPTCLQFGNEVLILGGFSCDAGSVKTVLRFDYQKNTLKTAEKELDQPGWSIYQPIRQGRTIHVFYGGEEGYPPHHLLYDFCN